MTNANSPAKKRLRNYLLIFAVCLILPLAFLVRKGYQQFQWEMYFPYRWSAAQTSMALDDMLHDIIVEEQNNAVDDYHFYTTDRNPLSQASSIALSPLSKSMLHKNIPGFFGYFEIDSTGNVNTPLLPFIQPQKLMAENLDLKWPEIDQRLKRQKSLNQLLQKSGFTQAAVASKPLLLSKSKHWQGPVSSAGQLTTLSLNVGPFQLHRNGDGKLIFYRNVQGEVYLIQGFVVDQEVLFSTLVKKALASAKFESTILMRIAAGKEDLLITQYDFDKGLAPQLTRLQRLPAEHGVNLLQRSLSKPFDNLNVEVLAQGLPLGPASMFMSILLAVVVATIVAGLWVIYSLGLQQIRLAEDRLNFVSAVSHELRTPLTSIIMYAEMLRENMIIDEHKRRSYYDYIFFESERLSRLIANVLQLSRLSRQDEKVTLERVSVLTLQNLLQSLVSTLLEKNNFALNFIGTTKHPDVTLDLDAYSQICINLIDNAVKFSQNDVAARLIDIEYGSLGKEIFLSVRDFGPGIPMEQSKKIFEMFYRAGNELTRTKPGTGIGLALVSELSKAMGGRVQLINHQPGAEFRVYFPAAVNAP